jgi:arylsulfatase A-like enzyme
VEEGSAVGRFHSGAGVRVHRAQIQHIPMAFSWPGLKPRGRQDRIRAVDIVPTVLKLMGVPKVGATPLDGEACDLIRAAGTSGEPSPVPHLRR